ncbi:WD40 repeat domain-containing serine/threonine protein kinase [Nocardiopsis sp. NPDC057823]|uniref:WD40 repeat domain-containing serine/threonine protein kinase n=1 Tax=Nocardiopsis sp. NPDC057823 TaxID=3346256 RepID=UPI00366F8C04
MKPLLPTDPPHIGRYRLNARLGVGGMGQVYLAHTVGGRPVVVKVIRPEHTNDTDFRARFAREAEAARRVGGFHTAQVVDSDPNADPPWIATAHIPGPSLQQAVQEHGPLQLPALRALAAGLAEGLEAIHTCGLVHRDLKPANIIMANDGPRIIDFGIARPLDASGMTQTGALIGTLSYMSPEQAQGQPVGPASDVFSLGTVLAFAATGANPFAADTMAATVLRVIGPAPEVDELPAELCPLIGSCWNHDPTQRPSPESIIGSFEDSTNIPFQGPTTPTSTQATPSHLPHKNITPDTPGEEAESELQRSSILRSLPRTKTFNDSIHTPAKPSQPENPTSYNQHRRDTRNETKGRRFRWILIRIAACIFALVFLMGSFYFWPYHEIELASIAIDTESATTSVSFSPDGSTIASGGRDDTIRLWDIETGENVSNFTGHESSVYSVAFSPDGTKIASGSMDDTIRLWDVETGQTIHVLTGHGDWVQSVAFSPDGATLVSGGGDGSVRLWNVASGENIDIRTHNTTVYSVAYSSDGSTFASGSSSDSQVRDSDTGDKITSFDHDVLNLSVALSPDGRTLATGTSSGAVHLRDISSEGDGIDFEAMHIIPIQEVLWRNKVEFHSVAFSPDGSMIAAGGSDDTVRLWDVDNEKRIGALLGHEDRVLSVAFSPDGNTLASSSEDGTIRLWKIP